MFARLINLGWKSERRLPKRARSRSYAKTVKKSEWTHRVRSSASREHHYEAHMATTHVTTMKCLAFLVTETWLREQVDATRSLEFILSYARVTDRRSLHSKINKPTRITRARDSFFDLPDRDCREFQCSSLDAESWWFNFTLGNNASV